MSLDKLLPLAKYWLATTSGYYVAYYEDANGDFEEYLFTQAELAAHHTLLPAIIDASIAAEVASGNKAQVEGLNIDATLRFLTYPGLRYTDLHGRDRLMVFVFSVYERPNLDEILFLVGYHFDTQDTVLNGQPVRLVIDNHFDDFCVEIEELEAYYPGFRQRYTLAEELSITGEDFMQFVFPMGPVPDLTQTTPLVDVNFD